MSDVSVGNIEIYSNKPEDVVEYCNELLSIEFKEKKPQNYICIGRIGDILWSIHDTMSLLKNTRLDPCIRIDLLKDGEWNNSSNNKQLIDTDKLAFQDKYVLYRDLYEQTDPDGNKVALFNMSGNLSQLKKVPIIDLCLVINQLWGFLGFITQFQLRLNVVKIFYYYETFLEKVSYLKRGIKGFACIVGSRKEVRGVHTNSLPAHPAASAEIRKLDGQDQSLLNFIINQ